MNVSFCLLLFKFELFIIIFFFFWATDMYGLLFLLGNRSGLLFSFFGGQIKIGPAGPSLKLPNENKI